MSDTFDKHSGEARPPSPGVIPSLIYKESIFNGRIDDILTILCWEFIFHRNPVHYLSFPASSAANLTTSNGRGQSENLRSASSEPNTSKTKSPVPIIDCE